MSTKGGSFAVTRTGPRASARAGLAGLVLCAFVAPGVLGCELGNTLKDIGEALGDRDAESVDGEGEQVIQGGYYGLRFDGNNPDGVFVVAIEVREKEPQNRLRLIPFPSGEDACSAGPGHRFGLAVSRPGKSERPLEARIPFVVPEAEGSPRMLRFTNFACEVDDVVVEYSGLPLNSTFASEPGFIAQTSEGELHFVSPWTGKKQRIASDATPIFRTDLALFAQGDGAQWMWTIEKGEIVARDQNFDVVGRVGVGVDAVQHTVGNAGAMLAYHQSNDEIYTVLASSLSSPKRIQTDACRMSLGAGGTGPRVMYYSPCAAQDLTMTTLDDDEVTVLAEGISGYNVVGERSDGPVLMYIENEDKNPTIGTLYARFGLKAPVEIGERGNIGLTRLSAEGDIRAVLDWGENGGSLQLGTAGEKLDEVATGVVYVSSFGVIGDWDGLTGTLYGWGDDDTLSRVTRNVATRGLQYDSNTKRALVLVDYDGHQGELTLIRDGEAKPMSKNVRPDSYQFTVQLPTVTVLSDLDEETGTATLKLRELDTEDESIVSEGVSEVVEVSWPKSGLLYSIPVGERAGIWFTEAR